ncbi:MAG: polymerase sigma-70 factor, subfamily [Actinomycetota bacterium]|jgi:RNA polymerase sigma-70 factor (ECF subfamily)|nr:polymerase sigma-70 factor, subfamily [Actinomycetota bacterium]
MESAPEFESVLAAAQEGADWAVTVLYRALNPRLLAYLGSRDPRAADDLAAEVWLAVAQQLRRFEGGEDAFRAWVFSIARRRLADFRRTAIRRATDPVPADRLDRASGDDTEGLVLEGITADEAAAFVVATLPPDQADVILLRMLGGLDVDQVARLVGKRPGTVRVLQHRALGRLRKRLAVDAAKPVTR